MERQELVLKLQKLPEEIEKAEKAVAEAAEWVENARNSLVDRESALLSGKVEGVEINGKNAETRQAQLREATKHERAAILETEGVLSDRRVALNRLHNELKVLRSIAQLLSGEVA